MTSMQRFDPLREMPGLRRMMGRPFFAGAGRSWGDPPAAGDEPAATAWPIPMDVQRNDRQLTVAATLPGFDKADVDVTISPDRVLSIKASRQTEAEAEHQGDECEYKYLMRERRTGSFQRALRLPADLDLEQAAVALNNGVLTVTLPVAETAQTRRLTIGGDGG